MAWIQEHHPGLAGQEAALREWLTKRHETHGENIPVTTLGHSAEALEAGSPEARASVLKSALSRGDGCAWQKIEERAVLEREHGKTRPFAGHPSRAGQFPQPEGPDGAGDMLVIRGGSSPPATGT